MKKNRKDKGFSLVELLATITILGVISTIGIVSVQGLIENSKRTYYQSQKDTLVMAAQAYLNDHVSEYPKEIGQEETFDLKKLYTNRYVKEMIKDTNKVNCNEKQSVVVVKKEGQKKYTFKGYLKCTACEGNDFCEGKEDVDKGEDNKPGIIAGFSGGKGGDHLKEINADFTICASGVIGKECDEQNDNSEKITISSYSYKITKYNGSEDQNGEVVYNSKSIPGKGNISITQSINLSKYLPGTIKVEVKAINSLGKSETATATDTFDENAYARCGNTRYEGASIDVSSYYHEGTCKPSEWINIKNKKVRQVWVECDDKNGIGCSRPAFSGTYTKDTKDANVYVYDQKNNATACNVPVCIDITTPMVDLNIFKLNENGKRSSNSANIKQTFGGSSSESVEKKSFSTQWLNKTNYPNGIEVEITIYDKGPQGGREGTSGIANISALRNADGLGEDLAESSKYQPSDEIIAKKNRDGTYTDTAKVTKSSYKKYTLRITDGAGNKLELELNILLDLTPPTCSSTYADSNVWKKCPVTVKGECTDPISGCDSKVITTQVKETKNGKVSPGTVKDTAGNITQCPAVQVKCDDCTNTKKETGNCHNFDSCSATCGSGTVYGKKTGTRTYNYVSKVGNNFVCSSGTEKCTETCSKSCDDHLYLCRTGNTCLNTKPGVYTSAVCKYAKPQFWDFYGVKVGQDYKITQGEYAGYYVYNGCLSDKAVDCTGHCKSF